jgi:hypothetical protein
VKKFWCSGIPAESSPQFFERDSPLRKLLAKQIPYS